MVNCAAYGFNVESGTHRISMFKFPKELKRRKLWIQRLNRGRTVTEDFVPSVHSKLCLKHFEDSQFLISPKLVKEVGYRNIRLRLKPDAVPTLFETPSRNKIGHKTDIPQWQSPKRKTNIRSVIPLIVFRNILSFSRSTFWTK